MYSLHMVVKYILHYIIIMFRDSGNIVCNDVSSTYNMIAIYNCSPFIFSFLICLYDIYYMSSSVMDIKNIS